MYSLRSFAPLREIKMVSRKLNGASQEKSNQGSAGGYMIRKPATVNHKPFFTFATMTEKILILDFGSQYTQLIARAVREANVYCEIIPYQKTLSLNPV